MIKKLLLVIRDIIPLHYRPLAREIFYLISSIPYLGNAQTCSCCGWHFRTFKIYHPPHLPNPPRVICPHCRSLARHRWIWLYLKEHINIEDARIYLLHFAQEYSLHRAFKRLPNVRTIGSDICHQERVLVQEDISWLAFAESTFDAIVCNHVLEHVLDDRRAMNELYRVLKPYGWALVTTPVRMNQLTYEDASITDARQREQAFGQRDHVRWYGYDIVDRLKAVGFDVTLSYSKEVAVETREKYGIDEEGIIFWCVKTAAQNPG